MAKTLTPLDARALMTSLCKQATGQTSIAITSTADFVSVGEQVLATGVENTLNALSIILGKTFMAVRPYEAKFKIVDAVNSDLYNTRTRKISFYSRDPKATGDWNTDKNGLNLAMGRDNGATGTLDSGSTSATPSMWEQNAPVPLELNFAGIDTWEDSTTVYRYQLKQAFSNESEFASFVAGVMTEKGNDIESQKEAFNRMTLLNFMAGLYDLDTANPNGRKINLTKAFNDFYGTSYTSSQLRSTYLKSFLEFMVATIKTVSDYMTHRSAKYHWSPAKTVAGQSYTLLRHTPKSKQKLVLYNPLFKKAEAMVMPEIFNDRYLSLGNFESVDYWQGFAGDDTDASIKITPSIPNLASPSSGQTTGTTVELDYVVGMLFDTDAIMNMYMLEDSLATPVEARKRFYNIWWSFAKNGINDFTENAVLFTMEDPTTEGD